jgi:hypothetical protein
MPKQGFFSALFSDPTTLGSLIRYGVTPQEKYRMQMQGEIPGMPTPYLPSGEENPEATRYASQYLAHRYGYLPGPIATLGNEIAIGDIGLPQGDYYSIKRAGDAGREQAQRESSKPPRIVRVSSR